ncbi:hypothetical protein ACC848_40985, partial [Rhizobium johnstonii]
VTRSVGGKAEGRSGEKLTYIDNAPVDVAPDIIRIPGFDLHGIHRMTTNDPIAEPRSYAFYLLLDRGCPIDR